ncbi:MAG: hypothetical protein FWF56_05130 [Firmicutes bacterium]|nr:hypothetical protein [Bacillota bacterium]MCL1953354.1 hypothetical protein [Bacillota bacterium]
MKGTNKLWQPMVVLALVVVLLASTIATVIIATQSNAEQNVGYYSVRDIEMSQDGQEYVRDFKNYNFEATETRASFGGTVSLVRERIKAAKGDDIFVNNYINNITVDLDSWFDMQMFQYHFAFKVLDEYGNILYEMSSVTDGEVDAQGKLQLSIIVDGQKVYLEDMLEESNQARGWFDWLGDIIDNIVDGINNIINDILDAIIEGFKDFIVDGIKHIIFGGWEIIADTAIKIKCVANAEHNAKLEKDGNGVSIGNYIYYQGESGKSGYKSADYWYGFQVFSQNGCGVASLYNLLKRLGKAQPLSLVIYECEYWEIEITEALGFFGTDPYEIWRYLDKKGISHSSMYTSYDSLKNAVASKRDAKIIMSGFNGSNIAEGAHIYLVEKDSTDTATPFHGYNYIDKYDVERKTSLDNFKQDGMFMVGYII